MGQLSRGLSYRLERQMMTKQQVLDYLRDDHRATLVGRTYDAIGEAEEFADWLLEIVAAISGREQRG